MQDPPSPLSTHNSPSPPSPHDSPSPPSPLSPLSPHNSPPPPSPLINLIKINCFNGKFHFVTCCKIWSDLVEIASDHFLNNSFIYHKYFFLKPLYMEIPFSNQVLKKKILIKNLALRIFFYVPKTISQVVIYILFFLKLNHNSYTYILRMLS